MPHISVKMIEGRSEEQKKALADALEKALSETLGCSTQWVTLSIEDYNGEEWQEVFKKEVTDNEKNLYKKPQYDPKILL
ncbi:MAG: 4-oxalocrotonate tautomerase [Ruminococcaceae bacterium]|nr:4-oxalocrotonate tautomerase [Oscillospiraceae bacterium]